MSKIAQELYEEGREEGEANKAVAIARAMLARGLDSDLTAEVTGPVEGRRRAVARTGT